MLEAYEITKEAIPVQSVVKIDDTAPGMLCGNNAGAWTIGLYASGSNNYDQLAAAKPDFLVPDVSYVPEIIFGQIEPCLLYTSDKAEYIQKEKAGGGKVIMIGDGINDSPALLSLIHI